jgi:hypothetical protein
MMGILDVKCTSFEHLTDDLPMVNWTSVSFSIASDQTDVAAGFKRWTADDPVALGVQQTFYKRMLR